MSSIVLQNPRPQMPDPKMSRLGHQVCSHAVCDLVQCAFTVHCRTHQRGGSREFSVEPLLVPDTGWASWHLASQNTCMRVKHWLS